MIDGIAGAGASAGAYSSVIPVLVVCQKSSRYSPARTFKT
jgi:hypothetical protein